MPWLGTFLETNVRLYSVDRYGVRGVVFLSLDCERVVVTAGARAALRHAVPVGADAPPHQPGRARAGPTTPTRRGCDDRGRRTGAGSPSGSARSGSPTDLDHFVSARWGLHTSVLGLPLYVPNQHEPWPLHDATVVDLEDGLLASVGFADLAERAPDQTAFSPGVHTDFGLPRRLRPRP